LGEDSSLDKAINEILNDYETIYMELGIKTGFLLAKDIFMSDNITEKEVLQYKKMYLSLFGEVIKAIGILKMPNKSRRDIFKNHERINGNI